MNRPDFDNEPTTEYTPDDETTRPRWPELPTIDEPLDAQREWLGGVHEGTVLL
jgi:hypothetical protein